MKNCAYGRSYTPNEWTKLEECGIIDLDDGEPLELRNCDCGSTLAVPVQTLGDRVREARVARGWLQIGLAYHLSMSQSYVARVEAGLITPGIPALRRLAATLNVTAGWLLDGEMQPKGEELK